MLYDANRVAGVRTGDRGIGRHGEVKSTFEPGVDIRAKVTILTDGVRGNLTKALVRRLGLDEGRLRGLESHLSYRIALRTFSAAESRAVLGVPDAHHLPPTPGAAFLATGTDELVRFRAAYVSGAAEADLPGRPGRRTAHLFTAAPVPPAEEAWDRPATGPSVLKF